MYRSPARERSGPLLITAEMFRKRFAAGPGHLEEVAIVARVRLRNGGHETIRFPAAEGSFVDGKDRGLHVERRPVKAAEFEIRPGAVLCLLFETSSYTHRLLEDARPHPPLRFRFRTMTQEKITLSGPWRAVIPAPDSLPWIRPPGDPHVFLEPPTDGSESGDDAGMIRGKRLRLDGPEPIPPFPPTDPSLN